MKNEVISKILCSIVIFPYPPMEFAILGYPVWDTSKLKKVKKHSQNMSSSMALQPGGRVGDRPASCLQSSETWPRRLQNREAKIATVPIWHYMFVYVFQMFSICRTLLFLYVCIYFSWLRPAACGCSSCHLLPSPSFGVIQCPLARDISRLWKNFAALKEVFDSLPAWFPQRKPPVFLRIR